MKRMPEALGEREYDYEMGERMERKRNIMIRGIRIVGGGRKEEIKKIIKKGLGLDITLGG